MYFIYLDEAGNTGTNLQNQDQPIHFISGVALHISQMKDVENNLKQLFPKSKFGSFKTYKGDFTSHSKSNIIDNVMYLDSFNSYFMQLADSLTYIYTSNVVNFRLNKNKSYLRNKLSELAQKIEPLFIYQKISP